MISQAKIEANRRNARKSTGPKSQAGKARSGQNARVHGLAVSVSALPAMSTEIEKLAQVLAGAEDPNSHRYELARTVAEADLDLRRIRAAKRLLIEQALHDQPAIDNGNLGEVSLFDAVVAAAPELLRLDRYERRALSRRRAALHKLTR